MYLLIKKFGVNTYLLLLNIIFPILGKLLYLYLIKEKFN